LIDAVYIMLRLEHSLQAWGSPEFETVLKRELAQQASELPLQQGLATGNYVLDAPLTVVINSVADTGGTIRVMAGVFYQGVIGGCSCADDPTPISDINEYCEVRLDIDKAGGAAVVRLES
jgi:hypothetical protein